MTNKQKKNLAKSRARRRTLTPCKSNAEAIQLRNNIQRAIPKNEQQEYIAALLDATVITCESCEEKQFCDKRYEDCQYNPENEVD